MSARGWRTVPIGSLCVGVYDGPHATPKKTHDGPIFLGISSLVDGRLKLDETAHLSEEDFKKWTRRVVPRADDVVFSYETRLGEAALLPDGLVCCLGRRMALMRPDRTQVVPRFLLYAYLGPEFQETLRKHTVSGATVDRIPLKEFPEFPINVPDLDEQRRIAGVLGSLDQKIERNNGLCDALERLGYAFFENAIGQFLGDPASAPAGYERRLLGDVIEVTPPRSLKGVTVAPYLDMKNMPTVGHFPLDWTYREVGSGAKFANGDTLMARITPCLENGKVSFVDFLPEAEIGWGSTEYIVLRPREPLPLEVAYFLARHQHFRDFAVRHMSGSSGRQRVSASDVAQYQLHVPDAETSRNLGRKVAPLLQMIRQLRQESKQLAITRNILMPQVLSGEVEVAHAYDPSRVVGPVTEQRGVVAAGQ